ncbi:succinate dehydrogenase/fumarate reductase iron-sulfur subunit [Desulfobacter curvatus]|uniref:succinate dehydrogenase/fumarate reductase iron-sulfur subunit n=1 Tax=Desulfobacter curvatus TaxID=2290 RepID=UPI00035CAE3E|nr:succinate dehydrogenase/fumarate reductase iron-sulfur subunit [Desulfobacter curvatus]
MEEKFLNLTLKVWRQKRGEKKGKIETYQAKHISTDASFLEMLDIVNDDLTIAGIEPIAFDHDCREGICGMCGQVVNGYAHGEEKGTTLCQFHMRRFKDGDTIFIEPFRAKAFKVVKDLVVDRSAFDKIIQAGGYITAKAGGAPEANIFPVTYETSELAMNAAECIGCGACVAACPNASAMLFVSAKISHLALLPQGRPEAAKRALAMVRTMDTCGFGNCSNERECENSCPKNISITNIARLNREFLSAGVCSTAM